MDDIVFNSRPDGNLCSEAHWGYRNAAVQRRRRWRGRSIPNLARLSRRRHSADAGPNTTAHHVCRNSSTDHTCCDTGTESDHDTRDRYGRLLAYVWLEDRTFFNKQMIAARYAQEYTYSTPYRYQTDFKAAQQQAREAQPGLWAPDTRNGDTKQPANAALAPIARPRCQCDRGSPRCHGAEYGSARDGAVQHRLELEFVNGAVVRLGREVLRILDRAEHAVAVCEQLTPERLGGLNEPGTIGHGSQRPTARYVVERRPLTRPLH